MGSSAQNREGVHEGSGEGSGKVPKKVWEPLVGRPKNFGAPPREVQEDSREGSGVWRRSGRLRCRGRSESTGLQRRFWRRFLGVWEALVNGFQGRFRKALVDSWPGSTWCQRMFWRRFCKVLMPPGSIRLQVGSGAILGVSTSRKIGRKNCENNMLFGIPLKLIRCWVFCLEGKLCMFFCCWVSHFR